MPSLRSIVVSSIVANKSAAAQVLIMAMAVSYAIGSYIEGGVITVRWKAQSATCPCVEQSTS